MTRVGAERQAELRSAHPNVPSWTAEEWDRQILRLFGHRRIRLARDIPRRPPNQVEELQFLIELLFGWRPTFRPPLKSTRGRTVDAVWVDEAAGWVDPVAAGREAAKIALSPLPRYLGGADPPGG